MATLGGYKLYYNEKLGSIQAGSTWSGQLNLVNALSINPDNTVRFKAPYGVDLASKGLLACEYQAKTPLAPGGVVQIGLTEQYPFKPGMRVDLTTGKVIDQLPLRQLHIDQAKRKEVLKKLDELRSWYLAVARLSDNKADRYNRYRHTRQNGEALAKCIVHLINSPNLPWDAMQRLKNARLIPINGDDIHNAYYAFSCARPFVYQELGVIC